MKNSLDLLRLPILGTIALCFNPLRLPTIPEVRNLFATFTEEDWMEWEMNLGYDFLSKHGLLQSIADDDFRIDEYERIQTLSKEHLVLEVGYFSFDLETSFQFVQSQKIANIEYMILLESSNIILDFLHYHQIAKKNPIEKTLLSKLKKGNYKEIGSLVAL